MSICLKILSSMNGAISVFTIWQVFKIVMKIVLLKIALPEYQQARLHGDGSSRILLVAMEGVPTNSKHNVIIPQNSYTGSFYVVRNLYNHFKSHKHTHSNT